MTLGKKQISIIFIILSHIFCLGILIPYLQDLFLSLAPFHLFLMAAILVINQKQFSANFFITAITIAIAGFIVELLGVTTGAIFGEYTYGATLGLKLAQIPLITGLNWFILIFSLGSFLKRKFKHRPIIKSLTGAFILVVTDILIEPVAIAYNCWSWTGSYIPLQNYVAWFVISFLMLRFYFAMDFRKSNSVGLLLFITQFIFLAILNIAML